MVTVKSVEPGDNSFSINHIIRCISNFLRKSYLSQLCPYRPEILSLHFFQLVKFFLPLTKSVFLVTPIINFQSFCPTVSFSNENLGEPLHISIAHCQN